MTDEELDKILDEDIEEVPAVGVSTLLKENKPKKDKPKTVSIDKKELDKIKEGVEGLRKSISSGANIHRIWVKLGDLEELLKKLY